MAISEFVSPKSIKDPHNLTLQLIINDVVCQNGCTSDMVFNIPTLLEYITKYITLNEGDIIMTGTPSGVGPVVPGDFV